MTADPEPRGRVLLVDDAADLRALGTFVLLHAGYEVMLAASAADALMLLEISDPLPDLVVLDVQMPDLDGWSTLERIRKNPATSRLPVLMCTVKTVGEDEERIIDLRPDGHLSKPYSITDLESAVRALVPPRDAGVPAEQGNGPVGCRHGSEAPAGRARGARGAGGRGL